MAASAPAREGIIDDLRRLGVRSGDTLMVHASLRKLGLARTDYGEGGADLLLDALEEAIGAGGTLLMVLGTHYAMDWVNRRPVAERAALLAGSEPVDVATAPATPEVGWLAEAFRRRPGTRLSSNPSGRFAARGAGAESLLEGQPWDNYYGPGSPLDRLCAQGGRILRLGADPETVTALHFAEYHARLPAPRRTRWDYVLRLGGRSRHVWIECLDDSDGIAPWEGEDYFAVILKAYLALGRHHAGRVGRADAELIDAADIVAYGADWMTRNLV